jgi:hypothetical protein
MQLTTIGSIKCRGLAAALALAALPGLAQEMPNPLARHADADPRNLLEGRWNGANLERRSNCRAPQNNGFHGTYAEYLVSFDRSASLMSVSEQAITGLSCTYLGTYSDDRFRPRWEGNYTCSDNKSGTFVTQSFLATPTGMSIRLAIKLSGSESCDVDAILGGSRLP